MFRKRCSAHLLSLFLVLSAGYASGGKAQPVTIESPDRNLSLTFQEADETSAARYSLKFKDKLLIAPSAMSLNLMPHGPLNHLVVKNIERTTSDTTYHLYPGKTNSARNHYNEARVFLAEASDARRQVEIIFRLYNDGAAFRYHIPKQAGLTEFLLRNEETTFHLNGDPTAHVLPVKNYTTPYETYYSSKSVSSLNQELIGLPSLFQYHDSTAMAITEADLTDYAGMYLKATTATAGLLVSSLSPRPDNSGLAVKSTLPHDSPWRVIMVGDSPGHLIESNLITNLNPPTSIADTSWIKPGKTTFPWWNGYAVDNDGAIRGGLDTSTTKHYIDFCHETGIPYHTLDGVNEIAWYGGPLRPWAGQPIMTSVPEIDMPEVLRYAKEKNVRLRLWLNWEACRAHMHTAFPLYEKWGIEGVMIDLIDRDDQEVVNFINEMVALAAKHKLTVTIHNIYKPTGLRRTYPNLMAIEAVLNLEFNKWDKRASTPEHEVMVPFIRMLAGPLDYHHGGFRHVTEPKFKPQDVAPKVMGTRARTIARYVVYEDYLPMVADYPNAYRGEKGLEALVEIPETWDETKILAGKVGDYITIARRHGDTWYIGSMTDSRPRDLDIPLSFLSGGRWTARTYSDDVNSDSDPASMTIEESEVNTKGKLKIRMSPAGGHLAKLNPQ